MKAKLVQNTEFQRFYKLSESINKGKSDLLGPIDDICENVRKIINERVLEKYREPMLTSFSDGVQIICISDAHTHIERLVFPACYIDEEVGYIGVPIDIGGKHTMMIHGGDPDAVYDDEVYLCRLCQLNKLEWEGFEK